MFLQIPVKGFDNNFSYFLGAKDGGKVAIVDPGDVSVLENNLKEGSLTPVMILLTHSHFDHISGVAKLVQTYDLPVYMHKNAMDRVPEVGDRGVSVDEGDEIDLDGMTIKVLYTPGHIDDAVCYYVSPEFSENGVGRLITGDTLFVEACGRADLGNSDIEDLYKSLQRLKALPDDTEVYPGHDYGSKPVSTIGWEKEHNKYFLCNGLEEFMEVRG